METVEQEHREQRKVDCQLLMPADQEDAITIMGTKKQKELIDGIEMVEQKKPSPSFNGTGRSPGRDQFFQYPGIMDDIQPLPDVAPPSLHRGGRRTREVEPGAYALGGGIRPAFYHPRMPSVAMTNNEVANDSEPTSFSSSLGQSCSAENETLVHAQPINDDSERGELPTAKPMSERAKIVWKKKIFLSLTVEMLVGIMVIIGIALVVSFRNNRLTQKVPQLKQQNGAIYMHTDGHGATQAPTTFMDGILKGLNLPDYTLEAMQDHRCPQYKAYQWFLENQQSLGTYPKWRLKQRFALATFFFATRGEHWVNHHSWLDWETHECYWEQQFTLKEDFSSFQCDDSGHIQSLSFLRNKLAGTIPKEMSLLSATLTRLNLLGNMELNGQIPSEIGLLTKLTVLLTFMTKLSGGIPTEIGLLTNLRVWDSKMTDLSGSIPTEMGLLRDLKELELASKEITGQIPSELGLLSGLTRLSLFSMGLSGTLPKELYQLPSMAFFWLGDCPGIDLGPIIPALAATQMLHLERVVLQGNQGTGSFPYNMGRLSSLISLSLNRFQLSNAIPSEIGELTQLTALDLQENLLSSSVPSELYLLFGLRFLVLNSNILTGHLPPQLFQSLRKLEVLHLHNTHFSGSLASEIGLLTNLKELELQSTSLSGELPSELLVLPNLTGISVANTSLYGSIPDGLCHLLHRNELECYGPHGCYPKKMTTSVCQGTVLCGCNCAPC
ncbi:LRR receptor-like serine threonine-protein kinase [Seminavis robusta]|uniref:LRR receptor-like serine threonine-protein kinase n=1 Tax=Seminavis robusta TaxID=568900 RepID=A0A9N8HZE4_9STRA|nr:LRR receptor-like serine threonine-protein kinase [Seminavis robusta]|eukprot:Sro2250_g320780.1 LRR receptor-like serine threonine-protein kinase (724) ;mRNA; f:1193-3692